MAQLKITLSLSEGEELPESLQNMGVVDGVNVEWIFCLADLVQRGRQQEATRTPEGFEATFEVKLD